MQALQHDMSGTEDNTTDAWTITGVKIGLWDTTEDTVARLDNVKLATIWSGNRIQSMEAHAVTVKLISLFSPFLLKNL